MRLFTKTLLFFIGVIAFQAVLTTVLITNVTRTANLSDARRELEEEASILYDSFNSWKRQLWKSLIEISSDGTFLGASRLDGRGDAARSRMERLLATKMDVLAVKDGRGIVADLVQLPPASFLAADLEELANVMTHPYIELALVQGTLCLVGVASLSQGGPESRADLFLLKRIDSEFCAQLTVNRRSFIAFLRGSSVLAGSLPADMEPAFFDPRSMESAYRELYDQRMSKGSYNAAFQRLGRLDHIQEGEELFLGTFLSDEPYDAKLLVLDRTILGILVATALITIVLSLFLSRNITHPVAALLAGMDRIRSGAWDTRVEHPDSRGPGPRASLLGGREIGSLFSGFNEMARELADRIRETVLLKEYNEKIVNSIRSGIAVIDRDLVVEKANNSFIESFGLDPRRTVGRRLADLGIDVVDDSLAQHVRSVLDGRSQSWFGIKRSKGSRVFEIKVYPFSRAEQMREGSACVLLTDDVTARTELEEKIFRAEKLSTISMLSAGMAHEINNPLGSILTNVQNLMEVEQVEGSKVSLRWIEQETRRIARIVQELLNFAATDTGHAPGSDVNLIVGEVVRLVDRSRAREGTIRIDTRLAPGLPLSVVSSDELRQVTINLLNNSLQAIEGAGRILVCTARADDGAISMAVSDTGRGIAKEIVSRIFDPFFTTKANGQGTGLGLSVVYGIVTKYKGSIDVKSREGRGTRFLLRLPCLEDN